MEKLFYIAGMIAVMIGFAFVSSIFVMLLWNWLMPVIFGLKTITWIQAWGLSVLCSFLFKSSYSTKKD